MNKLQISVVDLDNIHHFVIICVYRLQTRLCLMFLSSDIIYVLHLEQWITTAGLEQIRCMFFLTVHSSSLVSFPLHSMFPYPLKFDRTVIYPEIRL